MQNLIRKLLREFTEDGIQKISFDEFSDPILIPQYQKYLVKFNGTSKVEKTPDAEKIIFTDKDGKDYIFNADDVQKSGSSPFYINLDVLRKYYDIKFDNDFVRYKENLSVKDYTSKLRDNLQIYSSIGRCRNEKCNELRNVISDSLLNFYGENYGTYKSEGCEQTDGFLNIFPLEKTFDENGNLWSKLNFIIYEPNVVSVLLMAYLKKYGTFEHGDFIDWVKEERDRLFKGPFLEMMLRNIQFPKAMDETEQLMGKINKLFPNTKLISGFCPATRSDYNELIVVSDGKNKMIFQPVEPKLKSVIEMNNKYYLLFSRRAGAPIINRNADFIITKNGIIFDNSNINTSQRTWEFSNPPIFNELPIQKGLSKHQKLK